MNKFDLDRLGMIASAACVVHCALTPVLLLVAPMLGARWGNGLVHWGLAVLVLPLATWVLYRGFVKHRSKLVLATGVAGALAITLGLGVPSSSQADVPVSEQPAPVEIIVEDDSCTGCTDTACGTTKMVSKKPLVEVEETTACSSGVDCCPTLVHDDSTGTYSLAMSPASILTVLGSIMLVFAHGRNRRLCACCEEDCTHQ